MLSIKQLEKAIEYHRKKYYTDYDPEISDSEFDRLVKNLKKRKPDSSILKKVGATPKRRKISLPFVLGSLKNIGIDKVLTWMRSQEDDIFASVKLDGVSLYAEWEDGILTMLTTRGDSDVGEDILLKAFKIQNLKTVIDLKTVMPNEKGKICARGEAVVEGKIPKKPDGKGERYKTRRSAAIGIVGRDDLILAERLSAIFYELIDCPKLPNTQTGRYKKMIKLGLTVPKWYIIHRLELARLKGKKTVEWMISILENREQFNYDIDGIVLTKNRSQRENVKIPKNSLAFKIDKMPVTTECTKIVWAVGRTGIVTPVVHINKIEIDGVEIEHPTGYNYDYLARKGIGVGAVLKVIRSGDVIPKIVEVVKKAKAPARPKKCPSCGSFLSLQGVNLVCNNEDCKDKLMAQVEYFIRMLGAENISIPTLKALNLLTVQDFYEITKEQILSTDGFEEAKASTFIEEREKTLKTTEALLLAAFSIPQIGIKTAEKIASQYFVGKFDNLFKLSEESLYNKSIDLEKIGPSIAESFSKNIKDYKEIYEYLRSKGLTFIKEKKTNKLKGKSFQLTGAMSKPRKLMELVIKNNGGVISTVSKNLDYLIIADKESTSEKAKSARILGVKMITEEQFMEMIK